MEKIKLGESEECLTFLNDQELNKRLRGASLYTWTVLKSIEKELEKERELYPGELWEYGEHINKLRLILNNAMDEIVQGVHDLDL